MQPEVPVTGQRRSVKVFGCVEIHSARFLYRRDSVFNAETYLGFLEQVARQYYPRPVFWVQDNASYHKDANVWDWFAANRSWWTVFNLPPYSPEFNATPTRVFRSIQRRPDQIRDTYRLLHRHHVLLFR